MSKPLELTVYPPYEPPTTWEGVLDDVDATHRAKAKRLNPAELSAEVLNAVFQEAECEVRGLRLALRYGNDHPAIDHWAESNRESGRQAMILERFANLPHYDEAAK